MTLFALPQPGPALGESFRDGCLGLEAEQRPEGAAEDGGAADAEQIAPGDAEVSVAEVATGLSRNADHSGGG